MPNSYFLGGWRLADEAGSESRSRNPAALVFFNLKMTLNPLNYMRVTWRVCQLWTLFPLLNSPSPSPSLSLRDRPHTGNCAY